MKRALTLLLLLLLTAAVSGVDVFSIPRKKPSAPVSYEVGKTGSGGGGSAFYGIPVDKRQRVLFLIDLSGSMTARTPEGISRIDAMKKELVSMLSPPRNSEEKSGNGSFFLVKYESKVSCFPPEKRFYPFRSILHIETALRHIRKLEASGSPRTSSLPENSIITVPSSRGEMKLSCFSAVMPVIGWNQWVK